MRRTIGWIVTIVVAAVAVAFAINNSRSVSVDLWPLPYAIDLPVFIVAFACIFLGLVAGGFAAWLSGAKWRRLARREARDIDRLQRSLAKHEEQHASARQQDVAALAAPSGDRERSADSGREPGSAA